MDVGSVVFELEGMSRLGVTPVMATDLKLTARGFLDAVLVEMIALGLKSITIKGSICQPEPRTNAKKGGGHERRDFHCFPARPWRSLYGRGRNRVGQRQL